MTYIEALHINGGAGGDDIAGIDSSEWDTVDLEWAGDNYAFITLDLLRSHIQRGMVIGRNSRRTP